MILLFLKSIIIGIANIIPGVSGGTLAVMLNVYDPITEKIGNFFSVDRKTRISYFFYLLVVLVGAATGIFLFANIIKYSITNYPRITVTVFTLLILPSIPYIVKGLDYKKKKNILAFCCGAIIMITFIFLGLKYGDKTTGAVTIQLVKGVCFTRGYLLKLLFCGIIAAGAMIIPGISGSLLLMMLGEYYNVVYLISSLASSIREKSFTIFSPLIMLALGIGIGLVAFSKAINYLLKNHREVTLFFIEGIITFSIIQMWLSI
ncbi:DUF368 domain-containing protein [Fusobacterium hwasookii]|uniref:DUF368 domain-containing protein n=2 Tax=Fusobacterium hwasookii TaxID=1583098 RepID=A0AAC8WJH7_9FUSO|nr:DUF368 domain-containing protein [Fusobacterium hwasookii]ALQ35426.1 hypothetical protein RN92_05810 [Fusobacterium hwasookii ChDC F206]ALQ37941.1 hypothetical protein RN97_06880 [Fusobacterium hwasookii ChDC F300]EJU08846.1 hypothetical protein B437_01930 [Fusobacterium hwasookii ChDC F128]QNE66895.1 DUF368 domain-containing protein [Fusobacterium hwasookii]QNE68375.1 DUF368 domain-containing protein [Fusobacterium hwasookii]